MIKKLKQLAISLSALAMLAVPALVPAAAYATNAINPDLCEGIGVATGSTDPTNPEGCDTAAAGSGNEIQNILRRAVEIFTMVVGAVSIIMIIFGGFKYITSGGASDKVTSAKNTIMYALIGLVLVAVAQVLVRFVLTEASTI